MMIKKCLIFLKVVVLLSCLNATAIAAQDLNSPVLNFSEFLQLVETHNHELKIKKMYLELNKQGVNIANSKYDPKFNLRGRLNHNAAKMHAEDTGSVWRVDNSYSYGLDVFSKRFKSGGTLGLGLERVENKTDFSQTVGTDYQSTESKVLLSFRQPLLKGFIGLDSVEYSLYRQKLRYEQDELVFIQFKNDLLYTAVLAYLDYSGDVQEKEIKKKSIQSFPN